MAFSEIYDPTFPPDTQAANQLGLDIRNFKTDIAQRIANLSGITVAAAEALGYETIFYGAPFIDSTTGKVYNIGGTFTEITALILANISENNPTLQAAIVAAIAAIPPTSPGPLVLPALTALQSPQISNGPGGDLAATPTATLTSGITTPSQIASCGYVQATQTQTTAVATYGSQTLYAKIPTTYNSAGVPVTFLTIQGGTASGSGTTSVDFTTAYLNSPVVLATTLNGTGTVQVVSVAAGNFSYNQSDNTSITWIAFGVSN